jgi:predicted GNAT family acetyltransferase
VRFALSRDPEEFAARTGRLLSGSLECNVLATVLTGVLEGAHRDPPPIFAVGVTDADELSFAGLRTPPFPLLTSPLPPTHAAPLMQRWLEVDPDVSAVSAVPETARAIAAAWERLTGGTSRRTFSEAMHVLDAVQDPPRPAPGTLRLPGADERDLLVGWMEDFVVETGLIGAAQAAPMVDSRLRQQGLLVWQDERPVSMVGVNPAVAGVVRIGPVYTPVEFRRRGYAGTAVAAISRRALSGGPGRCMLFTDLANPTSNKIYAEVGYSRCGDWEEIALESA